MTFFGFSDGGILGLLIGMGSNLIDTLIVSGANTYPGAISDKMAKIMKIIYFITRSDKFRLMLTEPDIRAEDLHWLLELDYNDQEAIDLIQELIDGDWNEENFMKRILRNKRYSFVSAAF